MNLAGRSESSRFILPLTASPKPTTPPSNSRTSASSNTDNDNDNDDNTEDRGRSTASTADDDQSAASSSPSPPPQHRPNWARLFLPSASEMTRQRDISSKLAELNPYVRPLTVADVESCVALEEGAFDENERCTREKFIYRLTKCPELTLGLFTTVKPGSNFKACTLSAARPVELGRKSGEVSVLLAHIVATLSTTEVVTDDTMDYPRDWASNDAQPAKTGHQPLGRTICLHSLGVVPEMQGKGLGSTLITAYLQQMNSAGIADTIALLAHDHIAPFYEKLGFSNLGESQAQFGGGGWVDMTYTLKPVDKFAMYG